MHLASLIRRALTIFTCFSFFLALLPATTFTQIAAQSTPDFAALKQQALDLFKQGKYEDALPVLQKAYAANPSDIVVLDRLAFCTNTHAITLTDPDARKAVRMKARQLAKEAVAAGDTDAVIKLIADTPEDASEAPYSNRADANAIMNEGESAFAKGDLDGAIAGYQKALTLDPKLYSAALYIGDCYFRKHDHEQAARWFLQAVQIDPNRETAYRYWGDDLLAQDRLGDARVQFVQAIVADPYSKLSWVGISRWAAKTKATVVHPAINPPGSVTDTGKNDKGQAQINVTIDPATMGGKADADGTSAWFIYTLSKATWHGDRFKKEFPNEKEYRHTLAEEIDGYQMVIAQVREGLRNKKVKNLDPALANLLKLSDEDLLEPFVLISKADAGIAKDYPAYRDARREKITQYINEWIIHPAP